MRDRAFHPARVWPPLGLAIACVIGAVGATDLTSGWVTVLWILASVFALLTVAEPIRWVVARKKSSPEPEVEQDPQPEPTPQSIEAPMIESQAKVFSPTITQENRPGWKAMCADGKAQQQPYGAVLYITSERETARDFRCLVRRERQEPVNAHLQGGRVGIHSTHYPHAFLGAPPMLEGEYTYEWFGYVDESPDEMLLASGTFRVNNHLQIFCGGDEVPLAQEPFVEGRPRRHRARLTSQPMATPSTFESRAHASPGQGTTKWPSRWRFFIGQGAGGVDLACRKWQIDVPASVSCVVEDPKGVRRPGRLQRAGDMVRCTYPDDFDTEAIAGLHFVHWLAARRHIFGEKGDRLNETTPIHDPIEFSIDVSEE
jgi:hypothetical protein